MKNNKGFTIIEIISVIALISLLMIICVPLIGNASKNIKKKALNTKIENIEKAAVLFGQEYRENFTGSCSLCDDVDGACYCYKDEITVKDLIVGKYIEPDNESNITNPLDESKFLNECEIQIYEKYGKVYAVYLNNTDDDIGGNCWYQE